MGWNLSLSTPTTKRLMAESGLLRSVNEMEGCIEGVALLMREMPHTKVRAVAERLERQKGELVKYIAPLKEKLGELQTQVEDPELVRLCLLEWRLTKEAAHKRKENSLETCQKQLLQWKEEVVRQARKMVRWLLGQVVRASSLVETINSWLRPFSGKASVTHRTMAAQGKWTGNLQFAQAVLEYPSV